jgi:4-alpha-glucanotransferase
MLTTFNVNYHTNFGQQIFIIGSSKILGNWNENKAIPLNYIGNGDWTLQIEIPEGFDTIEYKYLLEDEHRNSIYEWGNNRKLNTTDINSKFIYLNDAWRFPSKEEKALYSSAFVDVILKPSSVTKSTKNDAKKVLQFNIQVPRIGQNYQVCILGNQNSLGNWDVKKPFLLECGNDFPLWTGSFSAARIKFPLKYKYGIYDKKNKEVVTIEEGYDREIQSLLSNKKDFLYIKSDENFRYPVGNWKGAGVAVPVFSLRSKNSFGVGEFSDLIGFIDWAKSVGMKMVQILPINETIATHNWLDSYPYKAISVMALHPIYLNLDKMGTLKDEKQKKEFTNLQKKLNTNPYVNYPEVLSYKSRYYKLLFDQEKKSFFKSKEFRTFFESNKEWLIPYAAFVFLRDKMKSPNYREWGLYEIYEKEKIEKLCSPNSKDWDNISIHYFIQFHLDKQLSEAANYARKNGIVLKGDIPIGISPNSVEAWMEPHLFNLNVQAGAPPDEFAVKGQNWGFPTYNWEKMAIEDFKWWKKRLEKMADYFDAYRIDHILGFFRIWEIPRDAVEGLLGYFNPALPLSADEIRSYNVNFDFERMAKPYIRDHILENIFGKNKVDIVKRFLVQSDNGIYEMKAEYNSQKKINDYFLKDTVEEELDDLNRHIRDELISLISNVIFVSTGHDEWHPRISMQFTSSFMELDDYTKNQLNKLYIEYFYKRHEDFWYHKGMEKIPAIISASNMLVCGEDLGMVPDCVPDVMNDLSILSLEIQRMPKNPKVKFAHPNDAPYLSVCTTSTHDMSTIRGWWEENRDAIQKFYNNELGNNGEAPFYAEPWICEQIVKQHLYSPAMWTVFPIQDLLAIDGEFRWNETHLERINLPSNVRHKWRYRMVQSIEDLTENDKFNDLLKNLIINSGRNSDY